MTIGVIINNWANIIILGVYNKFIKPNAPDEEKRIYKINPITTGGRLMSELNNNNINSFPLKLFTTRLEEIRIENAALSATAIIDTYKERKTIFK